MRCNDLVIDKNVRNMEGIEKSPEFAQFVLSVQAEGVIEPITYYVDEGKNIVLHGHRRLLAARIAGIENVPTHRTKKPDEKTRISQQLVTGVQRKDLNHVDIAVGIAKLINTHGMTQKKVAAIFGLSEPWVSQHLGLLDLIEPLRQKVQDGTLAYRAGYEARGITNDDWEKWEGPIDAAKTVKDVRRVQKGINYAKEHDAPQQVVDTHPESVEKQMEIQPGEKLLRCLRLIGMATDSIKAAKVIAKENMLDIADALTSHVKEAQ